MWDLQYCHCLRVSADTPRSAKRRAHSAPGQYHETTWCVCVCVCVHDDGTQGGDTQCAVRSRVCRDSLRLGRRPGSAVSCYPRVQRGGACAALTGQPQGNRARHFRPRQYWCWTHFHPIPSHPPVSIECHVQRTRPFGPYFFGTSLMRCRVWVTDSLSTERRVQRTILFGPCFLRTLLFAGQGGWVGDWRRLPSVPQRVVEDPGRWEVFCPCRLAGQSIKPHTPRQ